MKKQILKLVLAVVSGFYSVPGYSQESCDSKSSEKVVQELHQTRYELAFTAANAKSYEEYFKKTRQGSRISLALLDTGAAILCVGTLYILCLPFIPTAIAATGISSLRLAAKDVNYDDIAGSLEKIRQTRADLKDPVQWVNIYSMGFEARQYFEKQYVLSKLEAEALQLKLDKLSECAEQKLLK